MAEPQDADSSSLANKSEAQKMLERMRATSVRLHAVVSTLDHVMSSIKRADGTSRQAVNEMASGSMQPASMTAATSLFEGLEMLERENDRAADALEKRVNLLQDWF